MASKSRPITDIQKNVWVLEKAGFMGFLVSVKSTKLRYFEHLGGKITVWRKTSKVPCQEEDKGRNGLITTSWTGLHLEVYHGKLDKRMEKDSP